MKKRAIPQKPTVTEDPDLAAQTAREESFTSEDPTWQGKPLHPYSSGRESLFIQLRAAAGAPPLSQAVATTDDFFPDAIRVLYLCSHTPEEWREHRRDTSAWLEHVEAWADGAIPLSQKADAAATAMNILSRAYSGEHVPVSRHGKTAGAKK
jgi:hypothetical protein